MWWWHQICSKTMYSENYDTHVKRGPTKNTYRRKTAQLQTRKTIFRTKLPLHISYFPTHRTEKHLYSGSLGGVVGRIHKKHPGCPASIQSTYDLHIDVQFHVNDPDKRRYFEALNFNWGDKFLTEARNFTWGDELQLKSWLSRGDKFQLMRRSSTKLRRQI